MAYNFLDKTGDFNNIVGQLYFRQAMQHLEDQQGQIKAYLNGDGEPALQYDLGLPAEPVPALQRDDEPVPVQRSTATACSRRTAGTSSPNGTDTCAKPGTGPGECGAGIRPAPSCPST